RPLGRLQAPMDPSAYHPYGPFLEKYKSTGRGYGRLWGQGIANDGGDKPPPRPRYGWLEQGWLQAANSGARLDSAPEKLCTETSQRTGVDHPHDGGPNAEVVFGGEPLVLLQAHQPLADPEGRQQLGLGADSKARKPSLARLILDLAQIDVGGE